MTARGDDERYGEAECQRDATVPERVRPCRHHRCARTDGDEGERADRFRNDTTT